MVRLKQPHEDPTDRMIRRARERRDKMANPAYPANMAARMALLARVDAGEITLAEAQAEIRRLIRLGESHA